MIDDLNYVMTKDTITVIWKGQQFLVKKGAPNFLSLRQSLLDENFKEIPNFLTIPVKLSQWTKGAFTVKDNKIMYRGVEIPEELNSRILEMASGEEDPSPLFNFWERLQKNPSRRSVQQLYSFLQHREIPIDSDGCFLAYKAVRLDYKDIHTGTIVNRVGTTHVMSRNQISDDPNEGCHYGFHVGSLQYAQTFGGENSHLLICKIDPKDVVCVPYDQEYQKVRVCKYSVIGHYGCTLPSTSFDSKTSLQDNPSKKVTLNHSEEIKKWQGFDKLSVEELQPLKLCTLRTYAAKHLKIIGASKIIGGKEALLARINRVRLQKRKS